MQKYGDISASTVREISAILESGELSVVSGGLLDEFEKFFAEFFGHEYGVGTCNGTAALHSGLFAVGVGSGDQVILPTYGYFASASSVLACGGIPVFCNIDEKTLTIDFEDVERKITSRTRALLVSQPWGNLADAERARCLADQYNLSLISDSSHAHAATWGGQPLGKLYDVVCASLGKNKIISGGELGVLTTSNSQLRDRALLLGHSNRVPRDLIGNELDHISNNVGPKYRPHPIAMKIALDQAKVVHGKMIIVRQRAQELEKAIEKAGFSVPRAFRPAKRDYWRVIGLGSKSAVNELFERAKLASIHIEYDHYSPLLHMDPLFTEYFKISQKDHSNLSQQLSGKIFQFDALQLWSDGELERILKLFQVSS